MPEDFLQHFFCFLRKPKPITNPSWKVLDKLELLFPLDHPEKYRIPKPFFLPLPFLLLRRESRLCVRLLLFLKLQHFWENESVKTSPFRRILRRFFLWKDQI